MSLSVCITGLVAEGRIPKGKAQEAERLYSKHYQALKGRMGLMAAASEASERTIKSLELAALDKQRQALLQVQTQRSWLEARRAEVAPGAPLSAAGAADHIRQMDYHRQGIARQAFGMMSGILAKHRRNLIGQVRAKSDLHDMLRELYGEATGNLNAREMADAWRQTNEMLRSRFNAAGGSIGKIESWVAPQSHDMARVRDAGADAWKAFVTPLLDRSKMIDHETGLPMDDARLDDVLGDIWRTLATDGWSKREAGGGRMGSVANRRNDPRILHFETPDGWTAYAERFGAKATLFDAMMGYVHGMSRDIAAMEMMGPNPASALKWQADWLEKSGAEALADGGASTVGRVSRIFRGSAADQVTAEARGGAGQLNRLWNEYSGANGRSENPRLTLGISALSAVQVSAKLGSAFLKSGGDFGTMIHTARFDGLPVAKMMGRYVQLMLPEALSGGRGMREQLTRLGLVSDEWTRAQGAQFRMSGEELTQEWARRLADFTIKASLLSRHTESLQWAFGMETLSAMVHQRETAWANLDGGFVRMLQRYGIDQAAWDKIRVAPLREERGARWLYPEDVGDQAVADNLMRLLTGEGQHAVITSDLDTRAWMNSLGRGSWPVEMMRSAFLFKAYPVTMASLHGRRMMREAGIGNRLKYGLSLVALTTIGGAVSQQLSDLSKGKDPEDMTRGGFWARGFFNGGGLSIFGDLIRASENRYGGDWGQTVLGPVLGGTVPNLFRGVVANGEAVLDGDPETAPQLRRDAVNTVLPETPGLSLWYIRLALDRLLIDQVREWSNPDYAASYQKMNQRAEDEGTRYFAPPGSRAQWRAPDWGNAIGQPGANPEGDQP
jgi:hypothetical protein